MKALFKSLADKFKSSAKPLENDVPASRKNLEIRKDNGLPQSTTIRSNFLGGREWQRK